MDDMIVYLFPLLVFEVIQLLDLHGPQVFVKLPPLLGLQLAQLQVVYNLSLQI